MKEEIIKVLKESLESGVIGIGISIIFFLSFSGLMGGGNIFVVFLIFIIFGYIVGTMIPFVINLIYILIYGLFPRLKSNIILELIVSFAAGSAVFYLCMYLISLLLNIYIEYMLYISLGVGVATVMIHLFYSYYGQLEEKVKLEQDNRKLAVIEERNRIARELHDSVSQNLFGISLNLNTLPALIDKNNLEAISMMEELQEMVQEVQTEMRMMIYELRPLNFSNKDFFESIESMISLFRKRYKIDIAYKLEGDEGEIDEKKQLVLYRVLQESLNNIIKHADAGKIKIYLYIRDSKGNLMVEDNGKGFNLSNNIGVGHHYGIKGMRERLEGIGGILKIDSVIGEGTKVAAEV